MVGRVRVEPAHPSSGCLSLHHDLQKDVKEHHTKKFWSKILSVSVFKY